MKVIVFAVIVPDEDATKVEKQLLDYALGNIRNHAGVTTSIHEAEKPLTVRLL